MKNKPFSIRNVNTRTLNKVLGLQKKRMVEVTKTRRNEAYDKYINEIKVDKTYPKKWSYGTSAWNGNKQQQIDDELDILIEELLREK